MDVRSSEEFVNAIETLMQEELHCCRQLHNLALERSRAIEEDECSRLATISPEAERLVHRIQSLERKLEPLRRAWSAVGERGSEEKRNILRGLVRDIHTVMGEILALEQESFPALTRKHSSAREDLLGLAERDKLTSYVLRSHAPARFLDMST